MFTITVTFWGATWTERAASVLDLYRKLDRLVEMVGAESISIAAN